MSSTSIALPRGLVPGVCFALLLAAPLFLAISLDSSSQPLSGRFRFGKAANARLAPVASNVGFFDGQVNVRVSVGFRPPAGSGSATRSPGVSEAPDQANATLPAPPRVFQIRVENRSDRELSIDVLRANSEFGDLSAGLQTIRLAPGQMTQTSVALNETAIPKKPLPVEVTLRLGDQEETRELILAPAAQPTQLNRDER